ncbi:MAG: hypothetical protein ACJ72H_07370 [Candidatus Sulfotelmatobacter sp.]
MLTTIVVFCPSKQSGCSPAARTAWHCHRVPVHHCGFGRDDALRVTNDLNRTPNVCHVGEAYLDIGSTPTSPATYPQRLRYQL